MLSVEPLDQRVGGYWWWQVRVVDDQWVPESGLVTAALKLQRNPLREFYNGVFCCDPTHLLKCSSRVLAVSLL